MMTHPDIATVLDDLHRQVTDYHKTLRQFRLNVWQYKDLVRAYQANVHANRAHRHTLGTDDTLITIPPLIDPPTQDGVVLALSDVSDAQWQRVAELLEPRYMKGRPVVDTRRTLNGIRYVLATGCGWHKMPARYGSYTTCWRRLFHWQTNGTWVIADQLLDQRE
jgi:hypothetical protein